MTIDEYLRQPGAMTFRQLRDALSLNHDAQLRQWQRGYKGRQPDTANCVLIERATGGVCKRWDLRPNDWWRHWPDLIGTPGAPAPVPLIKQAA